LKKFVFRFRKTPIAGLDLANISNANMPLPDTQYTRKVAYDELMNGGHETPDKEVPDK
jgi:hypothetical protein